MLTDLERVEHMLDVADSLLQIASSATAEQYAASVEKQFAVKFAFVMLGEDAAQISQTARERFPDIPWRVMRGMRNIVVHDYCKTEESVIWATAVGDVRDLRSKLAAMADKLRRQS